MTVEETRRIVHAHHDAYRRRDVAAAVALLGEPFSFSSPMMAFDAPRQHAGALERFAPFVTGCEMISELYGDGEATLVYDLRVALPPRVQRTAEHFRVRDGLISAITVVSDATPWHPIVEAAGRIGGPLDVTPAEPG